MKKFLWLLLWCFQYILSQGQICKEILLNLQINDSQINTEIYTYTYSANISKMTVNCDNLDENTDYGYFRSTSNDGTFKLYTTENFANINADASSTKGEPLTLELVFSCQGTSSQTVLILTVENTNQNPPTFSSNSYSYNLPFPLMPKIDVTIYGGDIIVTDIDFDNTDIIFEIDSDDFEVTTLSMDDKKYKAVVKTAKVLSYTESKTYTLSATDTGKVPKTTTATITLEVDASTGLDIPSFMDTIFTYNYTKDSQPTLIQTGNGAVLKTNKPSYVTFDLNGDAKNYFDLSFNDQTSTFSLSVKTENAMPLDTTSPVVLTLSASTDVTVSAIFVITIIKSLPVFSKYYYIGSYSFDSNTISWDNAVAVSGATSVNLSGDKKDLFDLNSSTFDITPKDPLTSDDFDENSNIILTITAKSESGSVEAMVFISAPKASASDNLEFSSLYYEGSYSVQKDSTDVVALDDTIGFSNNEDSSEITISVENEFENYFKIEFTSDKWTATVQENLPESTIYSKSSLLITLTAVRTDGTGEAKALLILTLPSLNLLFSKDSYSSIYDQSESGTDTITIEENITVEGSALSSVVLTFPGYEEYFQGSCDSTTGVCSISLKQNLNSTILSSKTEILITIIATSGTVSARTVILVKLPQASSTFAFDKTFYSAEYFIETTEDGTASVQLNDPIAFTDANPADINIKAECSLAENSFLFSYDESTQTWNILVEEKLTTDVLSNNTNLVIELIAQNGDSSDYSKSVLILKLPDKISVAFRSPHYKAEYIIDENGNGNIVITDDSDIQVTDDENIDIVLLSYSENFNIKYDKSTSKFITDILTPLNNSILTANSELQVPMVISKAGVKYGDSVLTLKLPGLSFKENFYIGYYSETDDESKIEIDSMEISRADTSLVDISLSDYGEYFETTLDESASVWSVKSTKMLTSEIKEKNENLPITITAKRKSDETVLATSSIIINLPVKDGTDAGPSFLKFSYSGFYEYFSNGTAVVTMSDDIKVKKADSVTVYIENSTDYRKYFEINQIDNNLFGIKVEQILPDEVLNSETSLVFTLIAKADDSKGYATLVITLPKATKEPSVKFDSVLYTAKYENGATSVNINMDTSVDDNNIAVNITDDDSLSKYFTNSYANGKLKIDAADLPNEVLKKYSVITLTIIVSDKSTNDETSAVLCVTILDQCDGDDCNDDSNDDDDDHTDKQNSSGMNKGLLVAVIILACFLVSFIALVVFYWYFKIRSSKYATLEEDVEVRDTKEVKFTRKEPKKRPESTSSASLRRPTGIPTNSSASLRRPTGIPIQSIPKMVEVEPKQTVTSVEMPKSEKVVAFKDDVENIDGDIDGDTEEASSNFSFTNVAERRPTKFVFGDPLEEGVLDEPQVTSAQPEEERKKSVVFSDNIERVQLDSDEDDEDDKEDDESDKETKKDEPEYTVTNPVKDTDDIDDKTTEMPSQIFKEIF
ncbi:uncharacterized protein LOC143202315 [Rhynchophorus ferrugineus]|uniref:uncharacterized protein LOC143202315 n=1 Tax=Rhynchophorus ferrugineus TaxID=354439 RepID=UPI003FCE9BE2